jgi:hypothetical protein
MRRRGGTSQHQQQHASPPLAPPRHDVLPHGVQEEWKDIGAALAAEEEEKRRHVLQATAAPHSSSKSEKAQANPPQSEAKGLCEAYCTTPGIVNP